MAEEPAVKTLSETKSFEIWVAEEPDGEKTYHLELGLATVHLFQEEWEEFLDLVETAKANEAEG